MHVSSHLYCQRSSSGTSPVPSCTYGGRLLFVLMAVVFSLFILFWFTCPLPNGEYLLSCYVWRFSRIILWALPFLVVHSLVSVLFRNIPFVVQTCLISPCCCLVEPHYDGCLCGPYPSRQGLSKLRIFALAVLVFGFGV